VVQEASARALPAAPQLYTTVCFAREMNDDAQAHRHHAATLVVAAGLSILIDTIDCQFYDTFSSNNRDPSHDANDD